MVILPKTHIPSLTMRKGHETSTDLEIFYAISDQHPSELSRSSKTRKEQEKVSLEEAEETWQLNLMLYPRTEKEDIRKKLMDPNKLWSVVHNNSSILVYLLQQVCRRNIRCCKYEKLNAGCTGNLLQCSLCKMYVIN